MWCRHDPAGPTAYTVTLLCNTSLKPMPRNAFTTGMSQATAPSLSSLATDLTTSVSDTRGHKEHTCAAERTKKNAGKLNCPPAVPYLRVRIV